MTIRNVFGTFKMSEEKLNILMNYIEKYIHKGTSQILLDEKYNIWDEKFTEW